MLVKNQTEMHEMLVTCKGQESASRDSWKREMNLSDLLPTFSGKDFEDPTTFITKCENILIKEKVPKSVWLQFFARQLKNDASTWWTCHGIDVDTTEVFTKKLICKYDNITILSNLRANYYGHRQAYNVPTEEFLTGKMRLHKRLFPYESEKMAIPYLIEMLEERIRPFLRNPLPTTFEELMLWGNQRQSDLVKTLNTRDQVAVCFKCGDSDHYARQCPQLRVGQPQSHIPGNGYPERK